MIDCKHFSGLDLCDINFGVCLRYALFTYHCPYQEPTNKDPPKEWYELPLDKVN